MESFYGQEKRWAYTLSEKYLLKTAFESPVVLYTYTRGIKLNVKAVMKYDIHSTSGEVIRKIDVMFTVPASKLFAVRQGITIDKTVKARYLRTS